MNFSAQTNIACFFCVTALLLSSCKKDPGNYTYRSINEAMVTGLNPIHSVAKGQRPDIVPTVSYTQDDHPDMANYRFQWLLTGEVAKGNEGLSVKELDDSKNFDEPVKIEPGMYNMLYRITDKKTGVWKEFPFILQVSVKTYEGWLLLSETGPNKSRLDMVNYQPATNTYETLIDALAQVKSKADLNGAPNYIHFAASTDLGPKTSAGSERLIAGTTSNAIFLGADTLNDLGFRGSFSSLVEDRRSAVMPGAKLEAAGNATFLLANNAIYFNSAAPVNGAVSFFQQMSKINAMQATGVWFNAAPFVSATADEIIAFDMDNSRFLWTRTLTGIVAGRTFNTFSEPAMNKLDKDLMYMARTTYNGGETFAILKNKADGRIFLYRFTQRMVNYTEEITGTMMDRAENFAIDNRYGYIFYNVEGKIYAYDFALKQNREIVDYGAKKISLMKFHPVSKGLEINEERYAKLRSQLLVCSYDASNPSTSGTMDLYHVPGNNAPLLKSETFTGFGKVVSLTYRSR